MESFIVRNVSGGFFSPWFSVCILDHKCQHSVVKCEQYMNPHTCDRYVLMTVGVTAAPTPTVVMGIFI